MTPFFLSAGFFVLSPPYSFVYEYIYNISFTRNPKPIEQGFFVILVRYPSGHSSMSRGGVSFILLLTFLLPISLSFCLFSVLLYSVSFGSFAKRTSLLQIFSVMHSLSILIKFEIDLWFDSKNIIPPPPPPPDNVYLLDRKAHTVSNGTYLPLCISISAYFSTSGL